MRASKNTCFIRFIFLISLLLQVFLLILFGTLPLPQPALAFVLEPIQIEEDLGFDSIFRLAAADFCSNGRDHLVVLGRNYIENTALCRVYSWSGGAWEMIWESGNLIEEKSPIFLAVGRPFASGEETVLIMTNHRLDIFTCSPEGFTLTSQLYHTLLPQEITVADVNGDGIDELIVARVGEVHKTYLDMTVEVYALAEYTAGAVSLRKLGASPLCGNIRVMTGGDLDGDGQVEVLIETGLGGKAGVFSLLKWTGRELVAESSTSPLNTAAYALASCCLPGIDRKGVVAVDSWGRVHLFSYEDGQFIPHQEKTGLNSALVGAAWGDFDGDGLSELAVAGYPAKLFLLTDVQGSSAVERGKEREE
ncbi:MAG TPA: VCBS repeat-containing protein [Bacillota bacterium]